MAALAPFRAIVPRAQQGAAPGGNDESESTGWTRFRGPNGAGVAPDRGYPAALGPETLLWRRPMPPGKSSPILTPSCIFLTAERGNRPMTLCLDRATGRTLWERFLETSRREPRHPLNHIAAATAVTDGQNVFAFFADYGLVSYDSTGRERWRVPLGPFTSGWGQASSPVLMDGALVIPLDGYAGSYIAAFDQSTGKQRWRTDRDPMSHNYSTPIRRTGADGTCEIVVLGPHKLIAYDSRDGKERWKAKVPGGSIVSSPTLHNDTLVSTNYSVDSYPPLSEWLKTHDKNGDGILQENEYGPLGPVLRQFSKNAGNKDGAISEDEWNTAYGDLSAGVAGRAVVTALRLSVGENGSVAPTKLWEHSKNVPNVPSPLVYEGVLYLVATGVIVTTISLENGTPTKVARIPGAFGDCYASPVAADGKLFVVSEEGKCAVLKSGAQWDTLSVTDLGGQCYATPALDRGRVFVRTLDSLSCFGVGNAKTV
jgi:outer membrane protein assembly factor BamB